MTLSSIKAILWLLTLGVVSYLGYTLYDWRENQGSMLATRASEETQLEWLTNVEAPEPPKRELVNYKASVEPNFFDLNWTGKPDPPPQVIKDEPEVVVQAPKATPVDKLLRVLFVQVDTSMPDYSKALVRYKDQSLATRFPEPAYLYPGDALPEPHQLWTVAEIDAEGIVFRRLTADGEPDPEVEDERAAPSTAFTESLITKVGDGEVAARPEGERFPELRGDYYTGRRPPQTVEVRPNYFQVGTEDMERINENYLDILSTDVRTRTYRNPGGGPGGIQILEVVPGSVAAQHGAKTGDVIKSINGTPVNSTQEAISYVKNNSENYTVWEVVVWNSGKERTVTYTVP